MRNLEQIQESDGDGTPRGVTLLLVALGGACIVFAGLAIGGRRAAPSAEKADPLGELVTQQAKVVANAPKGTDLSARDVTFPGILSDEGAPTTALAAVKGGSKVAPAAEVPSEAISLNVRQPERSEERLAVAPLPAKSVLGASPIVTRPRDNLTRAATDAAQIDTATGPAAPPGREGGYQLQVSSFRTRAEADEFATQLRARAHKAYVLEARVPGRGTWYRVRIGPFASQQAAAAYRSNFEGREHVVPFVVQPSK